MAEAKATAAHAVKDDVKEDDAVHKIETDQEIVDHNRDVLKKEAEDLDGVSGPADNSTGDASEDPSDHIFSNDPYKKAFPPGPDDPTKPAKKF